MKNFYEATVIKPSLNLNVEIYLRPVDHCLCRVFLNDQCLFNDIMRTPMEFKQQLPLNSPVTINIEVERKHPQAIEVENINIDNFNVIPLYQEKASPKTNYIDFNGTWTLSIPNFYPWYHEVSGQGFIA